MQEAADAYHASMMSQEVTVSAIHPHVTLSQEEAAQLEAQVQLQQEQAYANGAQQCAVEMMQKLAAMSPKLAQQVQAAMDAPIPETGVFPDNDNFEHVEFQTAGTPSTGQSSEAGKGVQWQTAPSTTTRQVLEGKFGGNLMGMGRPKAAAKLTIGRTGMKGVGKSRVPSQATTDAAAHFNVTIAEEDMNDWPYGWSEGGCHVGLAVERSSIQMHKYIELCATICEFLGGTVTLPYMREGSDYYTTQLDTGICGSVKVGLTCRQSKAGALAYAELGPRIYMTGLKCRNQFPEVQSLMIHLRDHWKRATAS